MPNAAEAVIRLSADELAERCRRLAWLLLDVDGVLTDGRLLYQADGTIAKSFHTRDGLGIRLAMQAGLRVGTLSLRDDPALRYRAAELGLDTVISDRGDKGETLQGFLAERGLSAHEVAYMGDDLPDLPALRQAGLSAAPADAAAEVCEQVDVVVAAKGGRGAVRELVELLLVARGEWDAALAGYLSEP